MSIIPSSTEESETVRDGLLSCLDEYHALIPGVAVGAVVTVTGRWELAALYVAACFGWKLNGERFSLLRRERWYALGGFLLPVVLDWLARYSPVVFQAVEGAIRAARGDSCV